MLDDPFITFHRVFKLFFGQRFMVAVCYQNSARAVEITLLPFDGLVEIWDVSTVVDSGCVEAWNKKGLVDGFTPHRIRT